MTYDPLPTVQTAYSGHPRKGVPKNPTECTGKYSTSEKDCYSLIDLFLSCQLHFQLCLVASHNDKEATSETK
jgi:hypothetical protein